MDIGEARQLLKGYLSSKLRIDKWGLGLPDSIQSSEVPTSIGLDKPALDIEILGVEGWGESAVSTIKATIPFQVIYRFDSSLAYNELPRGEAENILLSIINYLNNSPSCIASDLDIKASGSVSVAEIKNSDQLILFEFDFEVTFECESTNVKSKYFSL